MRRMPQLPAPGPGQKRILDFFQMKSVEQQSSLTQEKEKLLPSQAVSFVKTKTAASTTAIPDSDNGAQQQPVAAISGASDDDDKGIGEYDIVALRFLHPPSTRNYLKRKKEKETSSRGYAGYLV
ncbi:hypothetical protein V8C26DRAFT_429598 [Trichoderma gracile]